MSRIDTVLILAFSFTLPLCAADVPAADVPKEWVDKDTGHRVVRLTDEPNSASLYFNEDAYTPDKRGMIYTTPDGISLLDLQTMKSKSVVHGRVRVIVAGAKTPSVFYINQSDHAIYSSDVYSGEAHKLASLPNHRGIGIASVNADETLAAGTYLEGDPDQTPSTDQQQNHPLDQPRNKGEMMEQRLAAHLPLVLFTINLKTGEMKTLLHSTDWINHLLFSPADPHLLMYCHEGPWHKVDRIWTIRTDGTQNQLIHRRTMAMEIAGHEFWSWDGKVIWYDLQTPKGEDFWLAGFNVETGERVRYHMTRDEWSIHFNVTPDHSLFCGDGGDPGQVAHARDGEWIYLFRPELDKRAIGATTDLIHPGVLHSERLVNMSQHKYHLEPNVRFSPDQKWVIFRSNMLGPTYVFGVEVNR